MKLSKICLQIVSALPLGRDTVVITHYKARATRGKCPARLLSELSRLARETGVRDACIHASPSGNLGFNLSFHGVPKNLRQRFQNVWGAYWR